MPGGLLALADILDGGLDLLVHRLVVVMTRGLDCFFDMLECLNAFAVLVVAGVLKVVLRLFEVLDGMVRVFCLLELDDGGIHLGLSSMGSMRRMMERAC